MGMQLPPGLVDALAYVGCTWPEADETALYECGQAWLRFTTSAGDHTELAVSAVETMVAENASPGIDAFSAYWAKVAGGSGYLAHSRIVAGGIAVAFFQAALLVVTLKLLVLAQLAAFAVVLAAALAAAVFTLGASMAAAASTALAVQHRIRTAVRLTITGVRQLGPVLAELARDHLSERIQRLDARPIHSSEHGVHSFATPAERAEAARVYEERKLGLAEDPARGGNTTSGTLREAEVALGLEATRTVPDPVERAENPRADFTDGSGQDWDVKGFHTRSEEHRTYEREKAEEAIVKKLEDNTNVVLDTSRLSSHDFADLKELVASHPEWAGKVVIY